MNVNFKAIEFEMERMQNKIIELQNENKFLKQRNTDLRQKSWYDVYVENLRLEEENKKYKHMIESIEKFIGDHAYEKR